MISSTPAVIEEEKVSHDIHDGSYITATNSMILYCMYMTIVYVYTNGMYVSLTQLTLYDNQRLRGPKLDDSLLYICSGLFMIHRHFKGCISLL